MKLCINCQKEIIKKEGQKPSHYLAKKFCNSSCSASFNNKNRIRIKKDKPIKEKAIKQNVVELKTKADLFSSRANWQSARSTIRKHAEKIIKASDLVPECKVCKYSIHVEICHIKALSDFEDKALIKEINDINNLVYLCPNHHWEFDNADLEI